MWALEGLGLEAVGLKLLFSEQWRLEICRHLERPALFCSYQVPRTLPPRLRSASPPFIGLGLCLGPSNALRLHSASPPLERASLHCRIPMWPGWRVVCIVLPSVSLSFLPFRLCALRPPSTGKCSYAICTRSGTCKIQAHRGTTERACCFCNLTFKMILLIYVGLYTYFVK